MSVQTRRAADGLLLAAIGEAGIWQAIRTLRSGMRALRGDATRSAAFLTAISGEGRMVANDDPRATVLVLGYRTER